MSTPADPPRAGHPPGIWLLFFTELWERFSYYGMRAVLVLFLVAPASRGGLGLDDRTGTAIYGLYAASVYIAGLPGGWIADRLIGWQRAVLAGGVIIAIGHVLLGSGSEGAPRLFFLGLAVIVIGTGLLKSNCSALVAQLYPEGGARRDAGFTLYYMGVNIGGTLGPLVVGWLAEAYGWRAGFLAAAIGMVLGVVVFARGRGSLGGIGEHVPADNASRHPVGWLAGISALIAVLIALAWNGVLPAPTTLQTIAVGLIIAVAVGYFLYLLLAGRLTLIERRRVWIVIVLFIASTLFWAGYEQAGSTLNLFADRYTDRHLAGWLVPTGWLQSLDSVFVIAFAPLFSALWLALGRRGRDPSRPVKFVLGLVGIAAGFIVMALAARLVAAGHQAGMSWLTLTYVLHTAGELCLSPIGMSAFSQLLPMRFVGQALGIWFVSLSFGNLLASKIAGQFDQNNVAAMPWQYLQISIAMVLCAALLAATLPRLKRWGGDQT